VGCLSIFTSSKCARHPAAVSECNNPPPQHRQHKGIVLVVLLLLLEQVLIFSRRPATVRGVRTPAVPSPSGPWCNIPKFVASTNGRRCSLTLLHLPAVSSLIRYRLHLRIDLETRPCEVASQLRSLPNVERLIFRHESYRAPDLAEYLGVLSDWPKLRRIAALSDVIKSLATLKHLHSRLPAVTTLSMSWAWGSKFLQNDLVFWSETLRDLTLFVRFTQHVD